MSALGLAPVTRTWFEPRYWHTFPFLATQLGLFALIFSGSAIPLVLPYPWYRLLHFTGAILLIGSAMNTSIREAFTLAIRTRVFTYYAYKWAGFADLFLFFPGAFLIAFAGASMTTALYGNIYATNWLFVANVSFFLSFLSYGALSYAQFRVAGYMLRDPQATDFSEAEKDFLSRSLWKEWALNGVCSVLTVYPIVLMVFKPELSFATPLRLLILSWLGSN